MLWDHVRTAYEVARHGTASAAAEALGVHRATVIRQVTALEANLGTPLFQRHARGYTSTETGLDLKRVAQAIEEQLQGLAQRAKGRENYLHGELIVTSVEMVAGLVVRAVKRVREAHPEVSVRYVASGRILQLAHGEAHVSVRVGRRPEHPDCVVRPWGSLRTAFYAHSSYIEAHGMPRSKSDMAHHVYVSHTDPKRSALFQWLETVVPAKNIVLRSASQRVLIESVAAGLGIGFMPVHQASNDPDLHQVVPPREDWSVPLWLVTHVDLHRTAKVRAVHQALMAVAEEVFGKP